MEIPVVQESKNAYQSTQQPAPGDCTGHFDAARQYFHSNNSSDVVFNNILLFQQILFQVIPSLELYRSNLRAIIPFCSTHYQSNSSETE
jgi:hypothetical protein